MLGTLPRQNVTNCVGEKLCEATQAAARAATPFIGRMNKNGADQAAVNAFHSVLDFNPIMSCTVVMGEGDKDKAPMLAHGDVLGQNQFREYDLAVDPIDGTTFVAEDTAGAIAVAALASPGNFMKWSGIHYMQKLTVGPRASALMENGEVRLGQKPLVNMQRIACELSKRPNELVIAVLDRPRNQKIIDDARKIGAKLILLSGGDIVPAILTSLADEDQVIDMLYSSGGSPEAVLAAAGVALRGGNMQAMWDPQTKAEIDKVEEMEHTGRVFGLKELVGTDELHFAMTSITGYHDLGVGHSARFSEAFKPGRTFYGFRVNNLPYFKPSQTDLVSH